MKKVLFGSTALVAAAFAGAAVAGDVTLSLGGGIVAGVGVGEYSGDQKDVEKDFHIVRDGEIHFKGKGTLDNGITIETRVELEAANYSSDTEIDESWIAVSGSFGKILIGGNDTAMDNVDGATGALGAGIGQAAWDGSYDFVPAAIGRLGTGDDIGIHYYTPNISGFELGVSWQPTGSEASDIDTNGGEDNTVDTIAVGASYSTEFGESSFTIGGGYVTSGEGAKEMDGFGVGVELGFDAITLGARYEYSEGDGDTDPDVEVTTYGAGIVYATGPWEFGLNAAYQDTDAAGTSDDKEITRVNAGVAYELGDGVDVGLGIDYADLDADGTSDDVDGFGAALLLGVSF